MGGSDKTRGGRPAESDLPLPPRLKGRLEHFRERLWSVKIAEGALAGLVGLGASYLLVFVLDRFVDTPASGRALLLAAGFAVPALGLPLLWHRWVWRHRSLADAARYLKRRHPRLGDELLGIVELARGEGVDGSRALVEAAMRQVDEHVAGRDLSDAVPAQGYGRRLAAALGVLALSGLLLALVSDAAGNALARWISPWKPLERYTFARLANVPDKLVVPLAEPFPLIPALDDSSEWRPANASLRLPGRTRLSAPLQSEAYAFDIPPQREQGRLDLRVGDSRDTILVEPLPRPELTALEAVVRLPDYLRYESDPIVPVRGSSLALVEGASAVLRGTTSRELASASAGDAPLKVEGRVFETAPIEIDTPLTRTFTWRDAHGLEAKSPLELGLVPVADAAPDLFANQSGDKRIVLEDEVVTFDINASDDFGLREIGLEWRSAETSGTGSPGIGAAGEKPVAAGAPEKRTVQTRGTFSAKREGVAPQTLHLRAFATDFLPGRERSYSPTFVLHILNPQDHAKWLTEEFGKWFRNARETYEREQQLHEANLALRGLSAEELDRPENRRRLQDQASAESGNARRLEALAAAGRGLVDEAVKNSEFDAERLESWAQMMRALDEIAKKRMPSVADLLQQSSRAPGGPAPGESGDGSAETSSGTGDNSPPSPPGLEDREKGLAEPEKNDSPAESPGRQASPPPVRLPETTLDAAPGAAKSAETPAQRTLDRALAEQRELLDEFARVTDELQEILSSLEASTFVKRFKAAARKQTEIADALSATLSEGFGLPRQRLEQRLRETAATAAKDQDEQSRFVYHIQTDLEAYYQRKQDAIYKNVLEQMKEKSVVSGIRTMGEEALANLNGRTVAAAELWADTLDRWAEELVAAAPPQQEGQQQGDQKSLPPEIVLQIMKALQGEMRLRDETREMEEVRPGLSPDVYAERVKPLEYTQTDLRERIDGVVEDIAALPDARQFGREIQLLSLVSDIMRQSHAVLSRPDTGSEAIAFQTEVIELLLQSKRQQSGGGGGSGNRGGGGAADSGGGSALSDIGPQANEVDGATPLSRDVEQSTGKAGRELPEEFRRGLDQYFNTLDSN